jgi:hypothetical protein
MRSLYLVGGGRKMFRLVAAGIAGMALGAAATAGAVGGFRIVPLHTGDVAPVSGMHVFCHVRSESAVSPYDDQSVECGETKHGIAGSFGIGTTDDAVYIGRWDPDVRLVTPGSVVYTRRHHH